MVVEHDRAVPMIEQIDQIMNALLDHDLIDEPMIETDRVDHSRAKLDHDLIVPITIPTPSPHTPVPSGEDPLSVT